MGSKRRWEMFAGWMDRRAGGLGPDLLETRLPTQVAKRIYASKYLREREYFRLSVRGRSSCLDLQKIVKTGLGLLVQARAEVERGVSDSRAFGSGGTSVAAQVTSSNDASCFDSSKSVSPDFVFSIEPPNQIVQCTDTRIWWDPSTVQGTPNFLGVIPGGQSFAVPEGSITQVPSQGTGFTWTPSLRGGTTLILVGGDNRGNGTAGSSLNVVSSGINNNGSCLSNSSPSSTPGSPAGGSYPTGSTTPSSGGNHSDAGAIAGGVIGGIAGLIILLVLIWFLRRKRTHTRIIKERADLLNDDDDEGGNSPTYTRRNELPQYYQPEPFMVPDPTVEGSTTGTTTDDPESRRPLSGTTSTSFYTRATTPDQASGSASGYGGYSGRKPAPRPMRAVNIIQHDDAGPSEPPKEGEEEPETIELPPAYTAVSRSGVNVVANERAPTTAASPPEETAAA
ncbi:hypothetical protein CPB84DRAFT_1750740 [Gymnopilus junonius]|uniref:Uncharacterized protein n=1 Tax=Gymnopilus junonius TaxID=109634 RepID=A0A9P5NH73_GYMJU|nr:hypothetical protein CPB84DRAFT_1750740 [Gymnopilus junonius]